MKKLRNGLVIVAVALAAMLALTACEPTKPGPNPTPTTYTVTYDLGGGQGTTPNGGSYEEGKTFTLAAATGINRDGYTFDKWNDGTADYAAGATYTMPAKNVTFTAKWTENEQVDPPEPDTYTVTYDLGGGEGTAPVGGSYEEGATFTLAAATGFNKDGYTFDTWNDGTADYAAGATYTMPAKNVTFTAKWTENEQPADISLEVQFQAYFKYAGGLAPDSLTKNVGDKIILPENTFTQKTGYENYEFKGWYIKGDDDTVLYQPGDEYTITKWSEQTEEADGKISYFLVFVTKYEAPAAPVTYTVTYKTGEHATGVNRTETNTSGSKIKLPTCSFTFDNTYAFAGWVIEGSQTVYAPGDEYTVNSNTVFVSTCVHSYFGYDNDFTGGIYIDFDDSSNSYFFADENEDSITHTLNGENISITVDGDTFDGTFANNVLTISITYKGSTYVFGTQEPDGTVFEGSCTTPTKSMFGQTMGGETYIKFIVDIDNLSVYYVTSDGATNTVTATDERNSQYKPDNYGNDAYYLGVNMCGVAYYVLIKSDESKLWLCDNDDEPLDSGEFTAREPDSEWVSIPTDEGSEFYNLCQNNTILRFDQPFENNGTTFVGIQFNKTSLGIGIKTVYISGDTEKTPTSSIGYEKNDGNLLVFSNNTYKITIGKKIDGNYYVISFQYKSTGPVDTNEHKLVQQ